MLCARTWMQRHVGGSVSGCSGVTSWEAAEASSSFFFFKSKLKMITFSVFHAEKLSRFHCQRFIKGHTHSLSHLNQEARAVSVRRPGWFFFLREGKDRLLKYWKRGHCNEMARRGKQPECLVPTFHCPGQDADRLTGIRCSGNTCAAQDSPPLPHFIL